MLTQSSSETSWASAGKLPGAVIKVAGGSVMAGIVLVTRDADCGSFMACRNLGNFWEANQDFDIRPKAIGSVLLITTSLAQKTQVLKHPKFSRKVR